MLSRPSMRRVVMYGIFRLCTVYTIVQRSLFFKNGLQILNKNFFNQLSSSASLIITYGGQHDRESETGECSGGTQDHPQVAAGLCNKTIKEH